MELANDFLNTPIKKIQKLSIHSPDIKQIMVDKGYSNSISDKVINELNVKLNDISNLPSYQEDKFKGINELHNDQFDKIHNTHFEQMESIMNHYSIKRNTLEVNNTKKKRRTLTGVEESPVLLNNAFNRLTAPKLSSNIPIISPTRNNGNHLLSSPINTSNNCSFLSSPNRVESSESPNGSNRTSPNRISPSRISPSRGSYNLNGILNRKISVPKQKTVSPTRDFKLPKTFTKIDPSNINNKPQLPELSERTTPSLQKKSSIPTLQKKPSIPTLQKKPSIPTLQKKPSIPTLQKKPSIPNLNKKSSIPTLQKKPSTSFSNNSISSISTAPVFNYVSNPTTHVNESNIYFKNSSESSNSLSSYAKPTISSSQKSLDRFTRFKNKFH